MGILLLDVTLPLSVTGTLLPDLILQFLDFPILLLDINLPLLVFVIWPTAVSLQYSVYVVQHQEHVL